MENYIHEKYIKAGHPETTLEELRVLAVDDIDNVRRRVAENSQSPPELLIVLAADENADVRMAVAENPQTPVDILHSLAEDLHVDVRYSIAENPNVPEEVLIRLVADENPYVCHRAQRTLRILSPGEPYQIKPASAGESQDGAYRQRWRLRP